MHDELSFVHCQLISLMGLMFCFCFIFQVELIDPALKGTVNVLRSCAKVPSIKRVVLTSSMVAVICNRKMLTPGLHIDETWFSDPLFCKESKVCTCATFWVSDHHFFAIAYENKACGNSTSCISMWWCETLQKITWSVWCTCELEPGFDHVYSRILSFFWFSLLLLYDQKQLFIIWPFSFLVAFWNVDWHDLTW